MALAIDGSTPAAVATGAPTATTASFTPPANSTLLVMVAGDANSGATPTLSAPTVTDNLGAHLTYTLIQFESRNDDSTTGGQSAMYWAHVTTSAAMTVSVTNNQVSGFNIAVKVVVITGADPTNPIGASGKGVQKNSNAPTQTYTAQATSGWGFMSVCDWDNLNAQTAGTGTTIINSAKVSTNFTYAFARRTLADDSNGSPNTITTAISANSFDLFMTVAEVVPAPVVTSVAAPLVVGTPWALSVPPPILSSSQPLGNPAVPTPGPLVVGPPYVRPPVPGAKLFTPTAVSTTGNAQVVGPPFVRVPVPPVSITSSQPLGNPAVGTPGAMVVSTPWTAKVPGAIITSNPAAPIVSTIGTPGALVVGPPFTPVPIPLTYLSASQPLGNPAVGSPQPLIVSTPPAAASTRPYLFGGAATTSSARPLVVVPTFTLAPVPGARVFSAPAAPLVTAIPPPGPLVVGTPWQPVAMPRTVLTASYPLGRPAVASPQPLVVGPPQRWPLWTASLITMPTPIPVPVTSCVTPRPSSGVTTYATATTARPGSGATARPGSGTTTRPDTGTTVDPC